ncbi:hypothetical protein M885DRAFT_550784 [Pelagophyceae sp. CCMP2097]|nr:hypothetical protein M885DRAFT_550784 [Pelagophyceae sp. CCMP2097]
MSQEDALQRCGVSGSGRWWPARPLEGPAEARPKRRKRGALASRALAAQKHRAWRVAFPSRTC